MKITQLSVVVPVRNEQDNVASLIKEIDLALNAITHEIIYVNDGSTDATYARLKELQSQFKQLRIVSHAKSCGQSTAVRTGVKVAQYDWVATLDGDGQNDPADIPKLMVAITDGVELAGGNRRASRRDTWVKRMSSVVANTVRSKMLNDDTPDTGCGLKLFKREAFLDLPYFDHMHRFLPALIKRRGGKIVSVPVSHRNREHGKSNYGTLDRLMVGIVDLFGVAWLQRRAKVPVIKEEG
ncbi:MAG: glycosyltransferase family 2 protein [Methylophilus sp.]|nr:glycosyltransferase family 2 protein [Methylophilus sp.]